MDSEDHLPGKTASHQHQKRWLVITYLVFLAGGGLWGLGEEAQLGGGAVFGPVMLFAGAAIHLVLRYLVWRRELERDKIPTTGIAKLMRKKAPIEPLHKRSVLVIAEGVVGVGVALVALQLDQIWFLYFSGLMIVIPGVSLLYFFYVAALYTGPGID